MEPGVTLFNLMRWPDSGPDRTYGSLVIVDAAGQVIWFHDAGFTLLDARRLRNGHLLYMHSRDGRIVEIDMLGNVMGRWHSTGIPKDVPDDSVPVDTDTFHHDVVELPNGNFLTLGSELRPFDDYPSSETDPTAPRETATLVGDLILEFARDGGIVRSCALLDILDPYRIGYHSLDPDFWTPVYGDAPVGELRDWSHANAVVYDARDDSAIVSSRAQDAVFKIDLTTGELRWILGVPDGWNAPWSRARLAPRGDLEWPYHQHAPMLTPRGTLLLYDNGNFRARPFEPKQPAAQNYSRGVEFAIDEAAMEVSQVWSHGGPGDGRVYSSFVSDADWLPATGNVLITHGGIVTTPDGAFSDGPEGRRSARIVEVTHTAPAVPVFELVVDAEAPNGWHVFRAERLSGLYPPAP